MVLDYMKYSQKKKPRTKSIRNAMKYTRRRSFSNKSQPSKQIICSNTLSTKTVYNINEWNQRGVESCPRR